jgi:hypothetical protein
MSGHSLKLYFCMFENHKGSIIIWFFIIVFEIFFINCKVYMLKDYHRSKMFLHVQSIQISRVDNPCFFQTSFLANVHHSF